MPDNLTVKIDEYDHFFSSPFHTIKIYKTLKRSVYVNPMVKIYAEILCGPHTVAIRIIEIVQKKYSKPSRIYRLSITENSLDSIKKVK